MLAEMDNADSVCRAFLAEINRPEDRDIACMPLGIVELDLHSLHQAALNHPQNGAPYSLWKTNCQVMSHLAPSAYCETDTSSQDWCETLLTMLGISAHLYTGAQEVLRQRLSAGGMHVVSVVGTGEYFSGQRTVGC
jgi:hypothetical protein